MALITVFRHTSGILFVLTMLNNYIINDSEKKVNYKHLHFLIVKIYTIDNYNNSP